MKKSIRTVCSLLIVFAFGSVWGSDTRITNMGYLANFYVRDSYNIWSFPSTLTSYRRMIEMDSQFGYEMWRGGIHVPVRSNMVFGLYLENSTQTLNYTDTEFDNSWDADLTYPITVDRNFSYPGLDGDEAAHQITMFWAIALTKMDIGILLSTYSSRLTYTDPDSAIHNFEDKLGSRTLGLGFGYKANERSRFEGSVFYNTGSFSRVIEEHDPAQVYEPESYNTISLGVRLFYAMSPKTILVPYLSYTSGGEGYRSLIEDDVPTTWVDHFSRYIIGTALELIPFEKTLITLSGGYLHYSASSEQTYPSGAGTPPVNEAYSYTALPFLTVGLETKLCRWMGVRLSFYELLETVSGDEPVSDTEVAVAEVTGSSYAARFGLFFHLGRFTLDALVDTDGAADFLHNGPYILSGKQWGSEDPLFTQITLGYHFDQ